MIDAGPDVAQPSLLRSILKWSLIAGGTLFVLGSTVLIWRPEFLLFHPSPTVVQTPEAIGWDYEDVAITTEDGETIAGWFLQGDGEGDERVVLFFHGNAGNIGDRVPSLAGLRSLGVSVLIVDYRGYGRSTGRATVAGTRLDAAAAWDHLVAARGYAPEQIVLWGRSLGGAVAIDRAAAASEAGTPPAALIVESSFTSTIDIGEALYPRLPVARLGKRLDYPSRDRIAVVAAPVLVAHSPDDDLIPASHGDALLAAAESGAATRTRFETLEGGHNEGRLTDPAHHRAVSEFLAQE